MTRRESARGALAATCVTAVMVTGACTVTAEVEETAGRSTVAVTPPEGPAFVWQQLGSRQTTWTAVVAGRSTALGVLDDATWLPDGRLLVARGTYRRSGKDVGLASRRLQVVDPASGSVLAQRPGRGDWGVTPEAITFRHDAGNRLTVSSLDLSEVRTIRVGDDAVQTDQIEEGSAELGLHHAAYTLDGVTWVQWGITSQEETTDHGVLRIEDGAPAEALRNQPVVDLVPSSDGAALLVLMQDNGESRSCGGCLVEQRIVELDQETGEVTRDDGMPPGYSRFWRVDALDQVGDTVVARFAAREEASDAAVLQTWTYDGRWRHLDDLDGTRTWWQDGGRLVWQPSDPRRALGRTTPFEMAWRPDGGADETLDLGADCPTNRGRPLCPLVSAPGAMLPPG